MIKIQTLTRSSFKNIYGTFIFLPRNQNVQSLKGVLQAPKQPVSIDDMSEAIAKMGALSK